MKHFYQQLEEIIKGGLEGNEYVSLLSWVMNVYPGPELMHHPDLQVDLSSLEPLIRPESLKELENEYLKVLYRFTDFTLLRFLTIRGILNKILKLLFWICFPFVDYGKEL